MVKSDSGVVSKPTALTPILCQRYTKVGWDTLSSVDLKVRARVWSVPAPQYRRVRHREVMAGIICRSPWVILVCPPPRGRSAGPLLPVLKIIALNKGMKCLRYDLAFEWTVPERCLLRRARPLGAGCVQNSTDQGWGPHPFL